MRWHIIASKWWKGLPKIALRLNRTRRNCQVMLMGETLPWCTPRSCRVATYGAINHHNTTRKSKCLFWGLWWLIANVFSLHVERTFFDISSTWWWMRYTFKTCIPETGDSLSHFFCFNFSMIALIIFSTLVKKNFFFHFFDGSTDRSFCTSDGEKCTSLHLWWKE